MPLSDNQIHKLGSRIRKAYGDGSGVVSEEDLRLLQEYRMSFRMTISIVFNIIYAFGQKVDSNSIITYRIKRINSIVEKLKRQPERPLERMIDIAGCRCILRNVDQVYKVLDLLRNDERLIITKEIDHISSPKSEGYKSYHVYVALRDNKKQEIEIQLRDMAMHNWATLVEITDTIIPDARLKEYKEPQDLLEFHRVLSLPEAEWTRENKSIYFDVLKKYNYAAELHKVFARNITVRHSWLSTKGSALKNFYLIEVDPEFKTQITSFRTFREAEDAYFEKFSVDGNSNIVLTQIQNATFEKISTAYSNYVLSTHQFSADCLNRYMAEIKTALSKKDLTSYQYFLDSYFSVLANQVISYNAEIKILTRSKYPIKVQQKKTKDWIMDMNAKIKQIEERKNKLLSVYKTTLDVRSLFYFRVAYATKLLGQKYDKYVAENS